MGELIVNGEEQILGRLSSVVAKKLLDGEKVIILNAEKLVISGEPEVIKEEYKKRRARGDPHHGPYYPKTVVGIVRRSIRGMLPKKKRGRDALKNLKIYKGNPLNKKGEKLVKEKRELTCKSITVGGITKELGGKNG